MLDSHLWLATWEPFPVENWQRQTITIDPISLRAAFFEILIIHPVTFFRASISSSSGILRWFGSIEFFYFSKSPKNSVECPCNDVKDKTSCAEAEWFFFRIVNNDLSSCFRGIQGMGLIVWSILMFVGLLGLISVCASNGTFEKTRQSNIFEVHISQDWVIRFC